MGRPKKKPDAKSCKPSTDFRDAEICELIASGTPIKEIAKQFKMSLRNVYDVKDRPQNATYIRKLRDEMIREISGRLSAMGAKASDTCDKIMDGVVDEKRLGAAKTVFEYAIKYHEICSQSDEILELKRQLTEQGINLK